MIGFGRCHRGSCAYYIPFLQKIKRLRFTNYNGERKRFLAKIKSRASALNKRIVLCEGEDSRVVKAAAAAVREGIAKITLLGDPDEIKKANPDVDLTGVDIVCPAKSAKRAEYAALLYSLRKAKGITEEEAEKLSYDNTYFGVLMLKAGDVDGLVSGACHSNGKHAAPRSADRQGCARRAAGFQLFPDDRSRMRQSVL